MTNVFIMLQAGSYHTLTVNRISDHGLYLADGEGDEVLLPNRYVSLGDKVGDTKEVFVYHDSKLYLSFAHLYINKCGKKAKPPHSLIALTASAVLG